MRLAEIFTSDMVLAAGKPIRIFGEGEGRAAVTLAGVTKEIVSCAAFWCVEFAPMAYGGPYTVEFASEEGRVLLENVYVGEVYLFSGQSNMGFKLLDSNCERSVYQTDARLHYVAVPSLALPMAWSCAQAETVGAWSALGYLTGRAIAAERNVHIGIIACAQGASVIESWMPAGTVERLGIRLSKEEKHADHYDAEFGAWNGDGFLYEDRLMRVIPLALSGVIWYQGESDASEAEGRLYERELCELIRVFREKFLCRFLPFCIVQLADCEPRMAQGQGWRLVQEAQARICMQLPNTYTVICRDICETDDIHPPTKDKLALRIADTVLKHF